MSSTKTLEKRLRKGLEDGDYYVAEQSCRTLYHRLTQSRGGKCPSASEMNTAFDTVMNCAMQLLSRRQYQAGTSLALLGVKHLLSNCIQVTCDAIRQVMAVIDSFVFDVVDDEIALAARKEQLRLLVSAINWSSSRNCVGSEYGHPALNARAGWVASIVGDYEAAQRYFVRSDAPLRFAEALDEQVKKERAEQTRDLLLAQGVLLYLHSGNMEDANTLRVEFARLSKWPANCRPSDAASAPPLANFCELLLKACQLGERAKPLFLRIRNVYEPALQADQRLTQLLDDIAARYFGVRPQQAPNVASMMRSMLSGMV